MNEDIDIREELDKITEYKLNEALTSEAALKALSDSLLMMNEMLSQATQAEDNMNKLYQMLDKIAIIVDKMKDVFQDKSEIESILKHQFDLNQNISNNTDTIKTLINVIHKLLEEVKKISQKKDESSYFDIEDEPVKAEIDQKVLIKMSLITAISTSFTTFLLIKFLF